MQHTPYTVMPQCLKMARMAWMRVALGGHAVSGIRTTALSLAGRHSIPYRGGVSLRRS